MLPGNPSFLRNKTLKSGLVWRKKLRTCWQEIQIFLGGETSLGTTLTDASVVGNQAFAPNPRLVGSGTNRFWI